MGKLFIPQLPHTHFIKEIILLSLFRTYSKPIILAGSGRSGTTWLANIIAANPNVRLIFEPFDHRRVPEVANLPLRPYARPGEHYAQWEPVVRQVLAGDITNEWVNRDGYRWWASKRLVKTIRATLMLGWLDRLFEPRIVFMMRHPCAVVHSRRKLAWETHLDIFLSQPQLMTDYLEPFRDVILGAQSEVEKHAVMWCVENLIPLRQWQDVKMPFCRRWVLSTYEQLYRQPEAEAARILPALGIRQTWFTQRAIKRLSIVARADSALVHGRNPLLEWQNRLSQPEIKEILRIVEAFGIELYGADAMPNVK